MFEFEDMPLNETAETAATAEAPEEPREEKVSLEYILEKVEAVKADDAHLREAFAQLSGLGAADAVKISAIQEMVTAREKTNQQLLEFYTALYNDQRHRPAEEWAAEWTRSAGESARKAGRAARETAKGFGSMMKGWLKDLEADRDSWTVTVGKTERWGTTLKEKVLAALKDPALDEEDRDLIIEYMDVLRDLSPEMQDEALDILTNPHLDEDEKRNIVEKLEAIEDLDG